MSRRPTVPGLVTAQDVHWWFSVAASIATIAGPGAAGLAEAMERPGYLPKGFPSSRRAEMVDYLTSLAAEMMHGADGEPAAVERARRLIDRIESVRRAEQWRFMGRDWRGLWWDSRGLAGGYQWNEDGWPVMPKPQGPDDRVPLR